MKRRITGFHQDEHNDWVAELDCLHGQHVRHKPPFFNRPWVISETGRNGMLGSQLNCVLCDRLELPAGLISRERTPEFSELTVPPHMLQPHALGIGTWGLIHVLAGTLHYVLQDPELRRFALNADSTGVIPPGVPYHLNADTTVRFFIEFLRLPAAAEHKPY